jgi:hypothetical protein
MKCEGSGDEQMLAWPPDKDGYPGAVVCLFCSKGVPVRKGSVRKATSVSRHEGLSGIVRRHDKD